jgi:hypothetical protein
MSRFDDFRIVRLWRGLNRAAQLLLAFGLMLGLNYLASQPEFFYRRDLTVSKSRSLAPETVAQLRNLAKRTTAPTAAKDAAPTPIEIFTTLPSDVEGEGEVAEKNRKIFETINHQLDSLLDAFVYESGREGRIPVRTERVDLTRNAKLYTDLAGKLGAGFDPKYTSIVVRCGERLKSVDARVLFRKRTDNKGNVVELDGFRGEEAILSAILEVTDDKLPVVYYTFNHGELSPEASSPLRSDARLIAELKSRRFDVRPLNLDQAREVPADANLVFVAGALADFQPRETDALRRYLRERNGRMLALIEPRTRTGLDDLFYDWGMLVQNVIVVENDSQSRAPDGDMLVRNIVSHDTTNVLAGLPLYAGNLRAVQIDEGRPADDTLSVSELFDSSDKHSWGERAYTGKPPYSFDYDKGDIPPRPFHPSNPAPCGISLGVAAERAVRMKGKAQIPAGRLVVVGTADIAADARFDKGGNRAFIINTANWLLDRNYLVNVPVRPLNIFKVNATSGDLRRLAWRYSALPAVIAILGFFVYIWRRKV